jgi:hypothetical protein
MKLFHIFFIYAAALPIGGEIQSVIKEIAEIVSKATRPSTSGLEEALLLNPKLKLSSEILHHPVNEELLNSAGLNAPHTVIPKSLTLPDLINRKKRSREIFKLTNADIPINTALEEAASARLSAKKERLEIEKGIFGRELTKIERLIRDSVIRQQKARTEADLELATENIIRTQDILAGRELSLTENSILKIAIENDLSAEEAFKTAQESVNHGKSLHN